MKLTKKHIGGLYEVDSADGDWAHMLIDVKNGKLLFYDMSHKYWTEKIGEHDDWRRYKPRLPFSKEQIKWAWTMAKAGDGKEE